MVNIVDEYGFETFDEEVEKYIEFLDKKFDNKLEVTIVYVDNETIHQLNNEFRNIDRPTDVLSFDGEEDYLGDIIISIDKMKEQAEEFKHSLRREYFFLVTHSYLHLLGYDHIEYDEEQEMFKLQKALLEEYGIKREI